MSLKNYKREKINHLGQQTWCLKDLTGNQVEVFTVFVEKNLDLAYTTQKRYAEVASRFIDYLCEAKIFALQAVSIKQLNRVIEAYPRFVRDGSSGTLAALDRNKSEDDQWLRDVALALQWKPASANTFDNTLAAVNRLLISAEMVGREEYERADFLGLKHDGTYKTLIQSLDGSTTLSSREINRMRVNSMLGSVAKYSSKKICRPKRLRITKSPQQVDRRYLDFPIGLIYQLIDAARTWRDKALWLLLAASGIRTSEARNILIEDIDFINQKIYINDPNTRRIGISTAMRNENRFKGRQMAETYLFPPLRKFFFEALEQYLKKEFIAISKPGQPKYLFQYMDSIHRGEPLVKSSDAAMSKCFKKAVIEAQIPLREDGKEWTLHSLRHLYGVYMLNDYPVDVKKGSYGLDLVEVQMLMGHASIKSTKHYARTKKDRLIKKLRESDESILGVDTYENEKLQKTLNKTLENPND
jgi:integrase